MTREKEEKREAERKEEGGKFIQEFHRALLHNRQELELDITSTKLKNNELRMSLKLDNLAAVPKLDDQK